MSDYRTDRDQTTAKIGGREVDLKRVAREHCLRLDGLVGAAAGSKPGGSAA